VAHGGSAVICSAQEALTICGSPRRCVGNPCDIPIAPRTKPQWKKYPIMTITSINPATNETLKTYETMTNQEAMAAIAKADDAYRSWRDVSFEDRKKIVLEFASQLRERADEYARLITLDMGKRIAESHREIEYCAEISEFYANGAEKFLADQPME